MSRLLVIAVTAATLSSGIGVARAQRAYRVLIDSTPRGASVYIGSKDDGVVGETPYRARLPEGVHSIILELDGYTTAKRLVDVKARRRLQKYDFKLEQRRTGIVHVSVPSGDAAIGAVVKIDGIEVGTAPDEFTVDIGPHVVEVVARGFDPVEDWIEVEEGETTLVEPELGDGPGLEGFDDVDGDGGDGDDDFDGDEDDGDASVRRGAPRAVGKVPSALLVLDTGIDLVGRHYSYSGVQTEDNLRPYDADGVPLAHVGVELYPLAGVGTRALRMVGLTASFDRSLSLSSTTGDGVEVPTTWTRMEVGARVRYPLGEALVGGGISYGQAAVIFDPPPEAPAELADQVPEVDYRYIRLGVDARYDEGRIGYFGGASYLVVSESGTSAERFRDYDTVGFGLSAGLAVRVVPKIEARVAGRYDRFSSAFGYDAGDEYVATGAADHLYGVLLGAAYVY